MANEKDEKSTPRLGNIDKRISLSKLGTADNPKDSGPLIGGKDSSAIGSFVGNVASGLGSVISAPFEAADRALAAAAGVQYRDEVASPIGKLGQGIESIQESIATGDPERADNISSKLGAGLGSAAGFMLPFAAAGNLGRVGSAAMSGGLGAAATGVEQATDYDRAREAAGLEPEVSDQAASLFYGMVPGTLEAVPIARMFGRLDNIAKGGLRAAVKNTAKGTVEEALQEGVQSVASNLIASDVVKYDQERDMFFDSGEAAAVGGGVGFIMNSIFSALGLRQRGGKYQSAAEKADIMSDTRGTETSVNPSTGEDFENQEIARSQRLIERYTRLAASDPKNRASYLARAKDLKDELRKNYLSPDVEAKESDKQEATDVLTGLERTQGVGVEETAEIPAKEAEEFPTAEGIEVTEQESNEEEAQQEEELVQQTAADIANALPEKQAEESVSTATRKDALKRLEALANAPREEEVLPPPPDENYSPTRVTEEEVVTTDDLVTAPVDEEQTIQEQQPEKTDEELITEAVEEVEEMNDSDVQNIVNSDTATIAQALKNGTPEERQRILAAVNQKAKDTKAEQQARADADIARAEAEVAKAKVEAEKPRAIPAAAVKQELEQDDGYSSSVLSTSYIDNPGRPMSGVLHTLRNNEDLESVLETGLKVSTNVGNRNSQAVGGGITLEYDPNDLAIRNKGYRDSEGTIQRQTDAKPKRVLIDIDEIWDTPDTMSLDELTTQMDQFYEAFQKEGSANQDEARGDFGGALMNFSGETLFPSDRQLNDQGKKEFEAKYGVTAARVMAENARAWNRAMDAASDTPIRGQTQEDKIQEIAARIPSDIPVYTYQVNEDGKPIGIKKLKRPEAAEDQDALPEGVGKDTLGDMYTGGLERIKERLHQRQSDRNDHYQAIESMTMNQVRTYRDLDAIEKSNFLRDLTAEIYGDLIDRVARLNVKEVKDILKQGKVEITKRDTRKKDLMALVVENVDTIAPYAEGYTNKQKAGSGAVLEGNMIGTAAGKPFKSERVAKAARTKKGLKSTHLVVTVEGGYALQPVDQHTNVARVEEDAKKVPDPTVDTTPISTALDNDVISARLDKIAEGKGVPSEDLIHGMDNADNLVQRGDIKTWGEWFETVQMTEIPETDTPNRIPPPKETQPEVIQLDADVYNEVMRVVGIIEANPRAVVEMADDIAETFGSVQQLTGLYQGIQSGSVVPKGETEQQTMVTPAGMVETHEAVESDPSPTEIPVAKKEDVSQTLDQVEARLDEIDGKVQDLQDELDSGYAENPSDLKKQIARLTREQRKLEESQSSLRGESQAISDKETDEFVKLEQTVDVIEDIDAEFEVDGTPKSVPRPSIVDINRTHKVVAKFWGSVDPKVKKDLEVMVVTKASDIKDEALRMVWEAKFSGPNIRGLHVNPSKATGGKSIVIVHPKNGQTDEEIQWTLFHEVVGHFGFKRMFRGQWDTFMELALKNKELASKAYALKDRWTNIDLAPQPGQPTITIKPMHAYSKHLPGTTTDKYAKLVNAKEVTVDLAGMRQLMDEYTAETAAKISNQTFAAATAKERSFLQRVLAWIRHFFRSKVGMGKVASEFTNADLMAFVGESYNRIHKNGNPVQDTIVTEAAQRKVDQMGIKQTPAKVLFDNVAASAHSALKTYSERNNKRALFEIDDPFAQNPTFSPTAAMIEAQAAVDESVEVAVQARIVKTPEEARQILKAIRERVGRIDNSSHSRRVEKVADYLRRSRAGRVLSSVGHLQEPRVLNAVESITKGGIERGQMMARKFANKTKGLNDIQKKAVYDYFKTKDAKVNDLPLNDDLKALTRDTKQYIEDLGESLVHLGLLRRETWEADRGSYLSIRYWKYVQKFYSAGGKRLSLKNYLKQQKGLTEAEKQALGEIKDPSFIVPETVATISRDVALHSMFKNILTMDQVGGLGWTLGNKQFVKVGDKKMKLSDIESNIETLEMLKDSEEGISPLWKDQEGQVEIERQLEELYAAKQVGEQALEADLTKILKERGIEEVTPEMLRQVLKADFVKVRDKRYGPLYNKYIRKELYEEIVDSGNMYNKEHTDFMGRWFGVGGHGEKAHQIWKASKVVLNPPSWARNAVGNMILLDIGSNTNTIKLMKMVAGELNAWRKGGPSKYFHMAHDQGLWNTTFSASELNLMSDQFQDKFKNEINLDNETQMFKKLWWFTHGKFYNAMEKATNIYGGMEGFFKTVALRDHVEQWEKVNGPIENADAVTRESVIREAAETANNNIFDYSKVPGWMRTMRRMPFVGAPFLTYTFKAIPASFHAAASRPQKMIKYAAFPYLMAQWFMAENDLDDDEFEYIRRSMPKWQKEQSSVFLMPYKDGNGKWQTIDFGYYLPWAAMHNTALQISHTLDTDNAIMSGLEAGKKSMMDLGFIGGPLPNMISALITNKDPFMGTEIVRTNGTSGDKTNDFMRYLVDLWTPTFLTSKGVLGRGLDNMGLEPTPFNIGKELTAYGSDRETAAQTALRGVGVNVRGFDIRETLQGKVKAHKFEKRKLEQARTKIFRDRNLSPEGKARRAKEINAQIKLLNQRHREELHGSST